MDVTTALANGSSITYAAISLSAIVPSTAKFVKVNLTCNSSPPLDAYISPDGTTVGMMRFIDNGSTTSSVTETLFVPLIVAQTIYYKITSGTAPISAYVVGWEF